MTQDAIARAGQAIGQARLILDPAPPKPVAAPLKVLGASALAAVGAILMAGAFILGPGVTFGP